MDGRAVKTPFGYPGQSRPPQSGIGALTREASGDPAPRGSRVAEARCASDESGLCAVGDLEFREDGRDVVADGFLAQEEFGCYRSVGVVLRDYRNYIHPQKELSHGVTLTVPDAQILWEAGKSISRQLLK